MYLRYAFATTKRRQGNAATVILLLALVLALASPGEPRDSVFVPGPYVPISEFTTCDASEGQDTIRVEVREDVLKYIEEQGKRYAILVHSDGVNHVHWVQRITGRGTGSLTLACLTSYTGSAVAATDAWLNELPIVTHWHNEGDSGAPEFGATGAINYRSYDPATGACETDYTLTAYDDSARSDDYYYDPANALFADDADSPGARIPAHERHVGESYSPMGIDNAMYIYFSSAVTRSSRVNSAIPGFPVVTSNSWFKPIPLVPAFQVFNGIRISSDVSAGHRSLATVLLPPYWNPESPDKYPILFTSHYGLNKVVYALSSECYLFAGAMATALARSGNQRSAVAVVWNAGGAFGTYSAHESMYATAKQLFRSLANHCHADPHAIMGTGTSRGCITLMNLASYPYTSPTPFSFKHLFLSAGPLMIADLAYHTSYWTYPDLFDALSKTTGLRRPYFTMPRDDVNDTFACNLLGVTGYEQARERGPADSAWLEALAHRSAMYDTKISLITGTHDAYMPFDLNHDYVKRARSAGVQIRHDILYRAGHGANGYACTADSGMIRHDGNLITAGLLHVLDSAEPGIPFENEDIHWRIDHYQQRPAHGDSIPLWAPFSPEDMPFVFEAPTLVYREDGADFTCTGPPFAEYRIEMISGIKRVTVAGTDTSCTFSDDTLLTTLSGVLDSSGNARVHFDVPSWWPLSNPYKPPRPDDPVRCYKYRVWFRPPADGGWIAVDKSTGIKAFAFCPFEKPHDTWDDFDDCAFAVRDTAEPQDLRGSAGPHIARMLTYGEGKSNGLCSE